MLGRILGGFAIGGGLWWLLCRICQGRERIQINAPAALSLGARGPFSGTVSHTLAAMTQPGRIGVYDTSPRTGNLIHLSSVDVTLS